MPMTPDQGWGNNRFVTSNIILENEVKFLKEKVAKLEEQIKALMDRLEKK
jgi:hypothetical protein